MHDKKPRRIGRISESDLNADLERYRRLALELGASDAKIISEKEVHVDSRVRAKCIIPKCPEYGSSAHCPPNMPEPEKIREFVQAFKHALLMKLDLDSFLIAGEGLGMADEDGKLVPTKALAELLATYRKFTGILTEIESHAFYDGHYFATAFSAASCHSVLCNFNECQVLKNQPCRFPLRSRPSMEASSMDVYRMVTEAGWDIYPIGFSCNPANVPHGTLAGLVLIC